MTSRSAFILALGFIISAAILSNGMTKVAAAMGSNTKLHLEVGSYDGRPFSFQQIGPGGVVK